MYRDVAGPNQAFAALLQSIRRRMSALERRIRWPGATRIDTDDMPANLPDDDTWYTYASLELDPGAWLILAGCTFQPRATSATTVYEFSARVTPAFVGSDAAAWGDAPTTVDVIDQATLQGVVQLTARTTVEFDLRYANYTVSQPTALIFNPYLIAVPI